MRVLVAGGAGLVGSHCAEFYAKKKAEVIVLDNLMRSFSASMYFYLLLDRVTTMW